MIPENLQLPIRPIGQSPEELRNYIIDLTYTLEDAYRQSADGINGFISNDLLSQGQRWIPEFIGNFTYVHQTGWAIRRALVVDVWYDIQWSASTDIGNTLQLQLPYSVANTNNMPFVGVVQSSNLAYTSGTNIVLNGDSNTNTATFYNVGNGIASNPQQVTASGRILGHLTYIGQQDE